MTLVSQIISDAYRESNITSLMGSPNPTQVATGLRMLQRIVASVYGNEEGDQLQPIPIGNVTIHQPGGYPGPYTPDMIIPLNSRVITNTDGPQTITLHPNPEDGSRFALQNSNSSVFALTVDANGRKIDDLPTELFTDATTNKTWMYRADLGKWVVVSPLAASDEMPFPLEFDDLFITWLAMRLNPSYTIATSGETAAQYKMSLRKFKARYNQVIMVGSELALLFTPGVRWDRGYYPYGLGNPNSVFNSGYPYRWS